MKTRLFVLAIMLLSSASSALADTRKVDEKHLQQHRENKSKLQKPSEKSIALKKKSSTKIKHLKVSAPKSSSILPNTKLDSFVLNSGGLAQAIYGDEDHSGPPPVFGFGRNTGSVRGIIYSGGFDGELRYYFPKYTGDFDFTLQRSIWPDEIAH